MSVTISASDNDQDIWMVANWAFRELAARVAQHPDADQDVQERFRLAEMVNGLSLDDLPAATQKQIASILIDTARDMAGELERPSDDNHDALFAERLRELVSFLERVYGPRPAAPNGAQAGR